MTCTIDRPAAGTLTRTLRDRGTSPLCAALRALRQAFDRETAAVQTETDAALEALARHADAVRQAQCAIEQGTADAIDDAADLAVTLACDAGSTEPVTPADRSETPPSAASHVPAARLERWLKSEPNGNPGEPGPLVRAALEAARQVERAAPEDPPEDESLPGGPPSSDPKDYPPEPEPEDEEEESDVEGETGSPVGAHPAEQRPRAEPDGVGELSGREWPEVPLPAREADPGVVDWICGDDEPLGVPAVNQTPAENAAKPAPKKRGNRKG